MTVRLLRRHPCAVSATILRHCWYRAHELLETGMIRPTRWAFAHLTHLNGATRYAFVTRCCGSNVLSRSPSRTRRNTFWCFTTWRPFTVSPCGITTSVQFSLGIRKVTPFTRSYLCSRHCSQKLDEWVVRIQITVSRNVLDPSGHCYCLSSRNRWHAALIIWAFSSDRADLRLLAVLWKQYNVSQFKQRARSLLLSVLSATSWATRCNEWAIYLLCVTVSNILTQTLHMYACNCRESVLVAGLFHPILVNIPSP